MFFKCWKDTAGMGAMLAPNKSILHRYKSNSLVSQSEVSICWCIPEEYLFFSALEKQNSCWQVPAPAYVVTLEVRWSSPTYMLREEHL